MRGSCTESCMPISGTLSGIIAEEALRLIRVLHTFQIRLRIYLRNIPPTEYTFRSALVFKLPDRACVSI